MSSSMLFGKNLQTLTGFPAGAGTKEKKMAFAKAASNGDFKKTQRTAVPAATFAAVAIAVFTLLAAGGCRNDLTPGPGDYAGSGGKERGTGTVVFNLGSGNPLQRTVKPNFDNDKFEMYRFTFTSETGGPVDPVVMEFRPGEWESGFLLEEGDWKVEAKAYISNKPVAKTKSGEEITIHVVSGGRVTADIDLFPIEDEGDGKFIWNIKTATDESEVEEAWMRIYRMEDADSNGNVDLEHPYRDSPITFGKDQPLPLPSGSYLAMVTIDYKDGSSAVVSVVVHIYSNLESIWNDIVRSSASLLDILLRGWNGSKWDFEDGFNTEHLGLIDEQFVELEGVNDNRAISKMYIEEIESAWTKYTNSANQPPQTFPDLAAVKPLVDITNVDKFFESVKDWNAALYNKKDKVAALVTLNAKNGTGMDFKWDDWKDGEGVKVDAGPYSFRVPIPKAEGIDIEIIGNGVPEIVAGGMDIIREKRTYKFNASPRGGWAGWDYDDITMDIKNITDPSGNTGTTGIIDITNLNDSWEVKADSDVDPGTTFELWATATEKDSGEVVEDFIKLTVIIIPPSLSATIDLNPDHDQRIGQFGGSRDYEVKVILSGSDLDIYNLDPAAPDPNGAQQINFKDGSGVLPGRGESADLFPSGRNDGTDRLSITGSFTIDDPVEGKGTGEIIIKGLIAYTDIFTRRITVKIGGAEATFSLDIYKDQATLQLALGSIIGGEMSNTVWTKFFSWPTGEIYYLYGDPPDPSKFFVTVDPPIPGFKVKETDKIMIQDGVTQGTTGMMSFIIPSGATAGTYTVTVELGIGSHNLNYAKDVQTFTIGGNNNNGLEFNDPTLSWPDANPRPDWHIKAANTNVVGDSKLVAQNIKAPNYNLRTIDWEGNGVHVTKDIYIWVYETPWPSDLVGTIKIQANTFLSP